MAESDVESDFEGFDSEDIENANVRSIGSDISVSSVSSDESDSDEEDRQNIQWSRILRPPEVEEFTEDTGASFVLDGNCTELDFFLKFLPLTFIDRIVQETNEYAARCIQEKADSLWYDTNRSEMMAYFGLMVVMSIISVPSYTLAWKSVWPFAIPGIAEVMTRTRFEKLSKYFHCNDTSANPPRRQPGHDRLCHVRPVIDVLSQTCLNNYNPPREQTVDEGMIAYKGRLSFKQYLPAKPTKFGIKVWERASPKNGYVHEFQIYTGSKDGRQPEQGLGARVVKDLTDKLKGKKHHIYMDNFFSSPELFDDLQKDKNYCTGTARLNRRGMPEALKTARLKNRGDMQVMQRGNLTAYAWKDKKIVTYLSTIADPLQNKVVRRKQKDGSVKEVPCPMVGESYNKFMFGVDIADQKRMQYSTCRKALKWWKYIFWFCFDLAVVNGFICMKESPNHVKHTRSGKEVARTQLEFCMNLGQKLIGTFRGSRKRKIPPTTDNCGNAHWPSKFPKHGRCKLCAQEKRRHEVYLGCTQCSVHLCVDHNCFFRYHQQM